MALSKTLIASQAAYHLGLPGFSNVETESSDAAVIINNLYDWALDSLLREHTWNFAIKRVTLATEVATPVWGYTKQATLPSDFIREIRINRHRYPYKLENGKLLSNLTTVSIVYVARITNPGLYDPLFAEALALKLAVKSGVALNRDKNAVQQLESAYVRALKKAKQVDSQEGTPENIVDVGYYENTFEFNTTGYNFLETEDLN